MTAGFLTVFGLVGLVLSPVLGAVQSAAPALTVLIGAGLGWVGMRQLAGRTAGFRLQWRSAEIRPGLAGMFWYGVTYAIVSLGCTLVPFLVAVGSGLTDSPLRRIGSLLAYGLGMSLVATVAALATAAGARGTLKALRQLGRTGRATGAVLVLVGAYVTWFGVWELRLRHDTGADDPVVARAADAQGALASLVERLGTGRLALVLALLLAPAGVRRLRARTRRSVENARVR